MPPNRHNCFLFGAGVIRTQEQLSQDQRRIAGWNFAYLLKKNDYAR